MTDDNHALAETRSPAAPAASVAATQKWKEVRYALVYPVEGEDGLLTEIVLREPDVEALERIDDISLAEGHKIKIAQLRAIIAALSRLPDETVKKLHKEDFTALGELAVPLLDMEEAASG